MDQHGAVPLGEPKPTEGPQRGRGRCQMTDCRFVGPEEDTATAQARMVWHVWSAHRHTYKLVAGTSRPPEMDRPKGRIE